MGQQQIQTTYDKQLVTFIPITELEIVHTYKPTFRLLGKSAFGFVIFDKRNGSTYDISLDNNQQELNLEQLEADERAAYNTKYGKLEPDLVNRLASVPAQELIPVIIQLQEPPTSVIPKLPRANSNTIMTLEPLETFHQQVANQRIADIKAVVNPVAERLKLQGYQISTNDYAARINVRLTPEIIREVEKWNEVKKIFIDRVNQPEILPVPVWHTTLSL